MKIGVPREIKDNEYRVAMTPAGVDALVQTGHEVAVEESAGQGSGLADEEFESAGAKIVSTHAEAFDADLAVKVKEPLESEYDLISREGAVFTYFHYAADRHLLDAMLSRRANSIAYETVERPDGSLPLLIPMSEVAGRMAIQEGAKYLERPMMGRGILLGGVPGVERGHVLVIGGGTVGTNAAKAAAGLGARVTLLDVSLARLRYLSDIMPKNVELLMSTDYAIREQCREADLVVGAVLIPGAKAPKLVRREYLKEMMQGAVIVDVAVDQGGCTETTKPTTHSNPTYVVDGVVHYCVANMPGAVGRTSTFALTNATLHYVREIAKLGWKEALRQDRDLRCGANTVGGKVTHSGVAASFGLELVEVEEALKA